MNLFTVLAYNLGCVAIWDFFKGMDIKTALMIVILNGVTLFILNMEK